jgi:hypothetical protein
MLMLGILSTYLTRTTPVEELRVAAGAASSITSQQKKRQRITRQFTVDESIVPSVMHSTEKFQLLATVARGEI